MPIRQRIGLLLVAGLLAGCIGKKVKFDEPALTTGPEDPNEIAARELRRHAWSEIERSRAAPVALESAAALALAAEKLFPGTPDNYILLAEARGRAGVAAGATAALEKALAARPGDAELEAGLELARAGLVPGKVLLPDSKPPVWLNNVKVELRFLNDIHRYDEPIPAEIKITNLGKEPVGFDPLAGVDPAVQLGILVHRKSGRYDYYGAPMVTFRAAKQLGAGESLVRVADINHGTLAVALAAYAPHYSRVLAVRAALMGDRGQPWAVDSQESMLPFAGVEIRASVLADLEDKLFSEPPAERLHLIKLYGHLVSGAPLPEPFAPRFKPYEYPKDKGREILIRLLKDEEPLVRATAARAAAGLGEDAGQPIIDLLTEALTDKQSWLARGQAAYALAKLQGKGAQALLRTVASEDPDEAARQMAAAALLQVDPTLAPPKPAGEGELAPPKPAEPEPAPAPPEASEGN